MRELTKPKQNLKILLVEDDLAFREQVVALLGVYNDISEASSLGAARTQLARTNFDVVLLDKMLPDGNGLDLIPEIKATSPQTVVVVLTGDGKNFNLVNKCLEAGASDYLYKSENIVPDLLVRIPLAMSRAAIERQSERLTERLRSAFRFEIVGRSAAMAEIRSTVQSLKGTLTPVLITGETGTGKELIAQRLHAVEDQPSRPFFAINCAAIPENLVESELFGHVKGAFSGAVQNQVGKFILANGGDLFLDEVTELPLNVQSKLLRVLQLGEVCPIGDKRTHQVSVRVIAAANKPIEDLIAQGKFREDLYYRLNVYEIRTQPLREHPEDIGDLVQFFLTNLAGPKFSVSEDALKHLSRQPWPGNIRELRNAIERAIILAKRRGAALIERQDIVTRGNSLSSAVNRGNQLSVPKTATDISPSSYQEFLQSTERDYLRTVLELCNYSTSEAASRLGIGRTTLFRKMTELGLNRKREPAPGLRTSAESVMSAEESV